MDVRRRPARQRTALLVAAAIAAATWGVGSTTVGADTTRATRVSSIDGGTTLRSRIVGASTVVTRASDDDVVMTFDEPLALRVVEPRGQRIVLGPPFADGADEYRPGGRPSTRLVVADLSTHTSRAYDVPRNVEPEAFGVGAAAATLFVVDHRPSIEPTYYRVGSIDLATGAFQDLTGPDKQPFAIDMTGEARRHVLSASGRQLYTLYLQHRHGDAARPPNATDSTAFVHVLDLEGGWAYCVDLPGVGHGPIDSASIRLAPSGAAVVVSDHHAHARVSIRTTDLTLAGLTTAPPALAVRRLRQ
jgi:hypothetical protein